MKLEEIENKIKKWFIKKDKKVLLKDNFLSKGIIDSFDLIDLIVFLEKEFKVKFENQDFADPDFSTIKNISKIVYKNAK